VIYLIDTSFWTTFIKWKSSVIELGSVIAICLIPLTPAVEYDHNALKYPTIIAVVSAVIAPLVELNHQFLKAYGKYTEFKEILEKKQEEMQEIICSIQNQAKAQSGKIAETVQSTVFGSNAGSEIQNMSDMVSEITGHGNIEAYDKSNNNCTSAESNVILGGNKAPHDSDEKTKDDDGKVNKDLIILSASPENSYIIQSDQLDEGEGVITVSWRVNASRRFHALDAIGMFPTRSLSSLERRSMDQCLCYRLVAECEAQAFGWQPNHNQNNSSITANSHKMHSLFRNAANLQNIVQHKIGKLSHKLRSKSNYNIGVDENTPEDADTDENTDDGDLVASDDRKHLKSASILFEQELQSPKLKLHHKSLHDLISEEFAVEVGCIMIVVVQSSHIDYFFVSGK